MLRKETATAGTFRENFVVRIERISLSVNCGNTVRKRREKRNANEKIEIPVPKALNTIFSKLYFSKWLPRYLEFQLVAYDEIWRVSSAHASLSIFLTILFFFWHPGHRFLAQKIGTVRNSEDLSLITSFLIVSFRLG